MNGMELVGSRGRAFRQQSSSIIDNLIERGRRIFDLSMINPDIVPPQILLDRLTEAVLKTHHHRYCTSRGIRKLLEAFAYKYSKAFQVELDPGRQLCVTAGAKDGFFAVLQCLQTGYERILLPSPCYPVFEFAANLKGYSVEYYDAARLCDGDLSELVNLLVANDKPAVLVLNSPNNPLGRIIPLTALKQIYQHAMQCGAFCINDFTYGEMCFSKHQASSLLAVAGPSYANAIELYSMSKAYSVPGWHIAAVSGDDSVISSLVRYKSFRDYGLFLPLQLAASAGLLESNIVQPIREQYEARATLLHSGLRSLGWAGAVPEAGCSYWAELPEDCSDAEEFLLGLLETEGVYLSPGIQYGMRFRNHVRIALVQQPDVLMEVVSRIRTFQALRRNRGDVALTVSA
jgi:alanine-synthesizing transaminase